MHLRHTVRCTSQTPNHLGHDTLANLPFLNSFIGPPLLPRQLRSLSPSTVATSACQEPVSINAQRSNCLDKDTTTIISRSCPWFVDNYPLPPWYHSPTSCFFFLLRPTKLIVQSSNLSVCVIPNILFAHCITPVLTCPSECHRTAQAKSVMQCDARTIGLA